MQSTFTMRHPENVEGLPLERMANADNGNLLREVLMMGSVSWLPLTRYGITSYWKKWLGG